MAPSLLQSKLTLSLVNLERKAGEIIKDTSLPSLLLQRNTPRGESFLPDTLVLRPPREFCNMNNNVAPDGEVAGTPFVHVARISISC